VLNALVRHPDQRCIVLGPRDVPLRAPPAAEPADAARAIPLSLFPMAPVTGDSEGLEWPLAGPGLRP
jgi:thiamine pyrophosphokinase